MSFVWVRDFYFDVAAVCLLGIITIFPPIGSARPVFLPTPNSRLRPRELQSPLFRWVIQGVHLADHGGRIRYTEGFVVVSEVLQGVPVLVVDFILQPGNESSKEKESAGLRGALRSAPRCRLPAASVATPRRSRPGRPGSPIRLPPSPPSTRPLPIPALSSAGQDRGGGNTPAVRGAPRNPPNMPPLPPPSAAPAPARETSRVCQSRGCCSPGGAHAQARSCRAHSRSGARAGREPSRLRGGDGAVRGSRSGDRAPLLPARPPGTGGIRPLFFVERCPCPLRSRQFCVCVSQPPSPRSLPPSLQYDVGHCTLQAAIFVCEL